MTAKYRYPASEKAYYERNKDKVKEAARKWVKNHPRKRFGITLKRRYGITLAQYDTMFDAQGGNCLVCLCAFARGGEESQGKSIAMVDHCHTTNVIRGLLCGGCNKGLGAFRDNEKALVRASAYLKGELAPVLTPTVAPVASRSGYRSEPGHGRHKLTDAQVVEIARRLSLGEKGRHLAKEFGVSPSQVSHIKLGLRQVSVAALQPTL